MKRAFLQVSSLGVAMLLGGCVGASTGNGSGGAAAGPSGSALLPATQAAPSARHRRDRRVLFISTLGAAVDLLPANIHLQDPKSLGTITQGVTRSQGVYVDRHGTLYVSNNTTPATVVEYKRGQTTPFKTISNGLYIPGSIAVDTSLNLYVQNNDPNPQILVYPPGANSPSETIALPQSGHLAPGGIALDPQGDLLVAFFDVEHNDGSVYSIAPGSTQPVNLNLQGVPGSALGVDRAGYIYLGGNEGGISVYAPGSKAPARFITTGDVNFYSDFAVTPNGTIYWPNFISAGIYEFAPGASGPTNVISGGGEDAAVGSF